MTDKDDDKMNKDTDDKKEDEFYKPEFHVVPDVDIPKEDVETSPLIELNEGDTIKVGLDSDVIIQKLSHEIYSNWRSALRELYNNEARACRNTWKNAPTQLIDEVSTLEKPEIHITINPVERGLIIEGRNSEGITVNVFHKSLRMLGVSSNFDGKEIGQMGMGFASYTLLFEAMKIDTWARATDEKWSALADGGINFKILGNPDMKYYGTRLSGTYKDSLSADNMIEHLQLLARFSTVPTFIHLTEDTMNHNSGMIVCDQFDNGFEWLMKERELYNEQHSRSRTDADEHMFIPVSIERDDFDFYGYWYLEHTTWGSVRIEEIGANLTTLIGTPVDAGDMYGINHLSGMALNIKDERKYAPTTDRDRMKEESMVDIEAEIVEELKTIISKFKCSSIKEYNKKSKKDKMIYDTNVWYHFEEYMEDSDTKRLIRQLNTSYTTAPTKHLMKLNDMLMSTKKIVALKGLRKDPMNRLKKKFNDNVIFFRLPTYDPENIDSMLQSFRELGVIMGEEYIREHKVKGKRSEDGITDVSLRVYGDWHARGWGSSSYNNKHASHMLSEINENKHDGLMRVSKESWNTVEGRNCLFLWVRDRKGFVGIKSVEERMRELEQIEFEVNSEKMLFKDIPHDKMMYYCDVKNEFDESHEDGVDLFRFNLNELRIEDDDNAYIFPAKPEELDSFFSNLSYMRDIIDLYCDMLNGVSYNNNNLPHLKELLDDRLDLTNEEDDSHNTHEIPLNKLIRLNRFKDLVPNNDTLYQLVKRAMLSSDENRSMDILRLGLQLGGVIGQLH